MESSRGQGKQSTDPTDPTELIKLPPVSDDTTARNPKKSCAVVHQEAVPTLRPVDIIFVIDNSPSMNDEIWSIQERINEDFAEIIEESGVDYRVIVISFYGWASLYSTPAGLCIRAPLGPNDCNDPARTPLEHSARMFHYNTEIDSLNGLCTLLFSFDHPDNVTYDSSATPSGPLYPWEAASPNGWSEYVRPEAFKQIVVVSDDSMDCIVPNPANATLFDVSKDPGWFGSDADSAVRYDESLRKMAPEHFGTSDKRNYRFHSIVGMKGAGDGSGAVLPGDPIESEICPTASTAGESYQRLSQITGGMRFPVCSFENYDAVFNALAERTAGDARLACEWGIPAPPDGKALDPSQVNLIYTPGNGEPAQTIPQVPSASECGQEPGWYFDNPDAPTRVLTCPSTCATFEADFSGNIEIGFGCKTVTRILR